MKKGITLVEVMVSMGIFAVLATLIVGAFVLILNMRSLTNVTKETQQKLRTSLEIVSRLARQANRVEVRANTAATPSESGQLVDFYFPSTSAVAAATRFTIGPINGKTSLSSQDCIASVSGNCTSWSSSTDMLGGLVSLNMTSFQLNATPPVNPPTLSIQLQGRINGVGNTAYYSDSFNIDNKVILESLPWAQY